MIWGGSWFQQLMFCSKVCKDCCSSRRISWGAAMQSWKTRDCCASFDNIWLVKECRPASMGQWFVIIDKRINENTSWTVKNFFVFAIHFRYFRIDDSLGNEPLFANRQKQFNGLQLLMAESAAALPVRNWSWSPKVFIPAHLTWQRTNPPLKLIEHLWFWNEGMTSDFNFTNNIL